MGFLKRLVGGSRDPDPGAGAPAGTPVGAGTPGTPGAGAPAGTPGGAGTPGASGTAGTTEGPTADEEERARERELLRQEADRLQDELLQRQLRYADRSWTPPSQGTGLHAEDTEDTGDA
jgi:hypothetical protein